MKDLKLVVMLGLPKSGKSTYVNQNYSHYQVLCADDIRLALGSAFNRNTESFVWSIHDAMLRAFMERGRNIIIDATNTTIYTLEKYKRIANDYDRYSIELVVLKTPLKTCLNRNNDSVPIDVIVRMATQFEDMLKSEAFQNFQKSI